MIQDAKMYLWIKSLLYLPFFFFTHIIIGILQDSNESYLSVGDPSNQLNFRNQFQDVYNQSPQYDGNFAFGQGQVGLQLGGWYDQQQASPQQLLVPDQYEPLRVEDAHSPLMFTDIGSPPQQQNFLGDSTREDSLAFVNEVRLWNCVVERK